MNLWIRGMEWGRHYWHSAASNICPTLTPVATKGTTIMRMTDEDLLQHDNCISTMTPSLIEPLRGGEKDTSFSLSSVAPSSGLRLLMTRLHRLKAHFLAFKKKTLTFASGIEGFTHFYYYYFLILWIVSVLIRNRVKLILILDCLNNRGCIMYVVTRDLQMRFDAEVSCGWI